MLVSLPSYLDCCSGESLCFLARSFQKSNCRKVLSNCKLVRNFYSRVVPVTSKDLKVGGKLALTSKRLIFKSHNLNIQNHSEAIFINDIVEVKASKVKSDDENFLTLQLSNNEIERFVVYHPSQWVQNIVQQKRVA